MRAFEETQKLLSAKERNGFILDSGCGTGESTVALATMHPGNIVIGIDRSAVRLRRVAANKLATREGNCVWVRARLETFWRLMLGANWGVEKNYFLYPNPWPKSEQMKKRWHAHPSFPVVLKLCRNIELRSNWEIYAEEFVRAIEWSGCDRPKVELFSAENTISSFEKKYAASGHKLYRVRTVTQN